jgi:3-oxoacyl-[acyl-carrier protein] reductase
VPGVTINFILPGAFETDRLRATLEGSAKKQGTTYETAAVNRMNTIPAKRFGVPNELGALCAFLCSAHAGFMTGQSILIDGGAYPGTF